MNEGNGAGTKADSPAAVAVIWQRFGPYHFARLRGAACSLHKPGWRVVGVEIAERDNYKWEPAVDESVARHTVFPGRDYSTLSPVNIQRRVASTLDELQPAAVCINGWAVPEAVAASRWCRVNNRRAILMSETFESSGNPLKAMVRRRRVRQFQAALVGGRVHADYLVSMGFPQGSIEIGYDAVDNAHFSRPTTPYRTPPQPYFLANTRFLPRKGIDALLRAYARYRASEGTPWDLVVSGSGEMERPWRALAQELGVASTVHWPGFVQYNDLPGLYQAAGAFVHPARQEPWGLVVNEAAAAGLPLIVGRRVGSACELVRDGENGTLVDPDDVDEFTAALRRIAGLTDRQRTSMGAVSKQLVAQFGPDRFGLALQRCLDLPVAH